MPSRLFDDLDGVLDKQKVERLKALDAASWELAGACLDILPADDLAKSGLTIIHLVSVWLNAMPEDKRALAYMQWLEILHKNLERRGVMKIHSAIEEIEVPDETVH